MSGQDGAAALLRNEPEIKSGLEAIRSTLQQRKAVLLAA
jgi:hypothetical protein